jgi:septal ring factor EnvC (AmiA/AmiB activator)
LLSPYNIVFIALIAGVMAFGATLNQRLLHLYRQRRTDVEAYRQGRPSPWLDQLIGEYQSSQERRGMQPNAPVLVDKYLGGLNVRAWMVELPVAAAERTVRFCGSVPVLLGLTGNFIGWMLALMHLRAAWPQMSADLKPQDMISLLQALQQPLGGLYTAFVLSVAGLLASLILNVIIHTRNAPAARDRFASALEDYLEHYTAVPGAPGDMRDLLVRVLDRFGQMAASIEQNVGQMMVNFGQVVQRVDATVATAGDLVGRMHPMASAVEQASGSIATMAARLESIVGRMEEASGSFAGGATTLERGLDSFGLGVHRLADAQDRSVTLLKELQTGTAGTLNLLAERMEALQTVEGRLADTSTHTVQALQAMVSPVAAAADQLKEQYLSLERQTREMEVSIAKLRASGDRLEGAATVMHETQGRFASELEQSLMRANQAQLQSLLESLNDLNRCISETQQSYLVGMQQTVGSFVQNLSHPVLEDLVKGLQRLTDQTPAAGARSGARL